MLQRSDSNNTCILSKTYLHSSLAYIILSYALTKNAYDPILYAVSSFLGASCLCTEELNKLPSLIMFPKTIQMHNYDSAFSQVKSPENVCMLSW